MAGLAGKVEIVRGIEATVGIAADLYADLEDIERRGKRTFATRRKDAWERIWDWGCGDLRSWSLTEVWSFEILGGLGQGT